MEPNNFDDVIDSRDIIERIEQLEADRAEAEEESSTALRAFDASEAGEELKVLKNLEGECEGYASDWRYGETLIRDSHFQTYAEELATDCDMLKHATSWPLTCIDWEKAARELQQDYTAVDFGGVQYWIRCS